MIKFNIFYFLSGIVLMIVEILIAIYLHDSIIRPYGGDFLVVILIYSFVKSIVDVPVLKTALYVLLFAYMIEVSQYFHLIYRLHLQTSLPARLILGTSFAWTDLLAYTLGIILVIMLEAALKYKSKTCGTL